MRDALLNLLVFLLVFLLIGALFLANYAFTLMLVPGGRGLVFANPFAAALFPSLLGGLVVAQLRSIRRPGLFAATWSFQAIAFFLLLTLPLPLLQQMPSVRASDASPLVADRFLPLEDGSLLLAASENGTILIPADGSLMTVSPRSQYDPLNQRFVFSDAPPRAVGSTGPERTYFQYTDVLLSLQTDLLGIYTVLRDNAFQAPLVFWVQAAVITWLFMGFYFFFSLKTWTLARLVLALLVVRLAVWFLVYSFWSLPALVELWLPGAANHGLKVWAPVALVAVAAASLFFMTLLTKPQRAEVPA